MNTTITINKSTHLALKKAAIVDKKTMSYFFKWLITNHTPSNRTIKESEILYDIDLDDRKEVINTSVGIRDLIKINAANCDMPMYKYITILVKLYLS